MTKPRLHHYIQDRLEGKVHDAGGREVAGPRQGPFQGRDKDSSANVRFDFGLAFQS